MANQSVIPSPDELRGILARFSLPGTLLTAERFGSGHINDTFVATYDQAGTRVRYILQRVNRHVFKNVPELMENISRVSTHIESKNSPSGSHRAPILSKTPDGLPYHQTPDGDFWRVCRFIEGARTYDVVEDPRQAYEAARAFGRFQQALSDLPGGRLQETIPHFHDTPQRLENLRNAAEEDVAGRKHEVLAELEFAFSRESEVSRLLDLMAAGEIPERVTHNDTKLNNVMLDEKTGEGICVIDLDTVMPGLSLYDFGDLVRFAANTASEDEPDLTKVDVSLPIFEAIVEGYIAGAGDILTDAEWNNLVFACKLMTYEVGIRFLTDYLQGDIYFKIHHPGHNLERARNQLRLVDRIETADGALQAIVRRYRAAR
jgi:aminoglycoside phosphotransferase (APT) family kinase protein